MHIILLFLLFTGCSSPTSTSMYSSTEHSSSSRVATVPKPDIKVWFWHETKYDSLNNVSYIEYNITNKSDSSFTIIDVQYSIFGNLGSPVSDFTAIRNDFPTQIFKVTDTYRGYIQYSTESTISSVNLKIKFLMEDKTIRYKTISCII